MSHKSLIIFVLLLCLFTPLAAAVTEGFTVASISKDGDDFLFYIIVDGSGESIEGYIYPENISVPGYRVQEPVKISVSGSTEKLIYDISNQGTLWEYTEPIYKNRLDYWNGAKCDRKPVHCYEIDIPWQFGNGFDRVVETSLVPVGSYGGIQKPWISKYQTISVTVGGREYSETIGTGVTSRSSIHFSGVPISARITGLTLTGRPAPEHNLYVATHRSGLTHWEIAHKPYYEMYVASLAAAKSFLSNWDGNVQTKDPWSPNEPDIVEKLNCKDPLCSDLVNMVTEHNSNVEKLLSQSVRIDYSGATLTSHGSNSSSIYNTVDRPITNAELVLRVRGSMLRVIRLSGIPEIEKIESPPFVSGDETPHIKISLKNIGEATGTFAARANGSFESGKITLLPGETGDLVLFMLHGLNASDHKTGTVEVYDIASGANASKKYELSITVPKLFIPNETRVYNEIVTESSQDGMMEYEVLDFTGDADGDGIKEDPQLLTFDKEKQTYIGTSVKTAEETLQIKAAPTPTPQTLYIPPPKLDNKNSFGDLVILIILGAIIITAGLIVGMVIYNIFFPQRHNGIRRKNLVAPGIKKSMGLLMILILLLLLLCIVLSWNEILMIGNEIIKNYTIQNIIK